MTELDKCESTAKMETFVQLVALLIML